VAADYLYWLRIIFVATLKVFWEVPQHRDAEQPLRTRVRVVRAASWADPAAIKSVINSADIVGDWPVAFAIVG
jgi:mRNA interferase HigB